MRLIGLGYTMVLNNCSADANQESKNSKSGFPHYATLFQNISPGHIFILEISICFVKRL